MIARSSTACARVPAESFCLPTDLPFFDFTVSRLARLLPLSDTQEYYRSGSVCWTDSNSTLVSDAVPLQGGFRTLGSPAMQSIDTDLRGGVWELGC